MSVWVLHKADTNTDQHARYLWRKILINANKEGASVMEGLSDSDAVLSPVTEVGKKGLSRKSLNDGTILRKSQFS